ncbi:hypothetical protein [Enterococcus phage vB_EfaM_Ef2.1]|uniref:Uncharacterized protein n=2 Tax=Kochikohdavirus TaxID=2560160 RepID=A0A9E7SGI7_9CAUD|nr:hypothetical protein [Enterococcus phage vB_EfaM_Ef2.1]QPW37254.1 hypothetical protein [Enterococcus phage PBEF129]USL84351.1 hypothetical protein Sw5_87 [Enterococcus phage Sw5]CAI9187581.1 hypothetical protein [Enterococcus phage Sw5]
MNDNKGKCIKQGIRDTYKGYDILLDEENGFFYVSVLDPDGKEIISGFVEADKPIEEYYKELLGKCDQDISFKDLLGFLNGRRDTERTDIRFLKRDSGV